MIEYPLHWHVFENDVDSLRRELAKTDKNDINKKDLRNKTPLELAVYMDHFNCAKLLCEHGADCDIITSQGWNLVQEAVSTGNLELIKLIMTYRDYQRTVARTNGIPELLNKLKQAPDFYVEMKWEFTSWIPLVSKACPSDVYKIYKSGSCVRIDTTLVGFNGTTWERGNRSYLFKATDDGMATIVEMDHLTKSYYVDKLTTVESIHNDPTAETLYEPNDLTLQNKLTSPNMVTFLDIDKIEFERNRSGLWGWRSDKNESINGYDCKVYSANNFQLVTKTRVEHLSSDKAKEFLKDLDDIDDSNAKQSNLPGFLTNILQGTQQNLKIEKSAKKLTALEYFQKQVDVNYHLNGSIRPIDENLKTQTFNATLSLCDTYPLTLHEQILPIVDLMALNNSHFKKLKEFITLQLPSGFPIKIEIPIFRVITAKVTFGNIHGLNQPIELVQTIVKKPKLTQASSVEENENAIYTSSRSPLITNTDDDDQEEDDDEQSGYRLSSNPNENRSVSIRLNTKCIIDEKIFKIPGSYRCKNLYGSDSVDPSLFDGEPPRRQNEASRYAPMHPLISSYGRRNDNMDDDDILLQLAIQQSLAVGDSNNSSGDVGGTQSLDEYYARGVRLTDDDFQLQQALSASLVTTGDNVDVNATTGENDEEMLQRIMQMSKNEEEERQRQIEQEEEELKKILELSLLDK